MLGRFFGTASSSNATSSSSVQLDTMNASHDMSEKMAAEIISSGARVFTLSIPNETVNLLVFGCHGEDSPAQRQIADEMLKFNAAEIDFAFTTGDNIYSHGADSPTAKAFKKYFYQYYSQLPFPIWMTLGNHDGNYQRMAPYRVNLNLFNGLSSAVNEVKDSGFKAFTAPPTGDLTEQNEVLHTFLGDTNAKIQTLTQPAISITELNEAKLKWVMPAKYYSYIVGKVQFIHLNSNTYVKDYLEYSKDRAINNQVTWLEKTYYDALAAERTVILVQHHSLFTCGKRVFHGDQDHYLNPVQIKEAEDLLGNAGLNYNQMLLAIFERQHFKPGLVLAAHDHSLYYYNNAADDAQTYKIAQVVSGGGGGKLQDRMSFTESSHVPMYLKQNGFCHLSFNQHRPEEIFIHFRTTGKHHVTFSNRNAEPIRDKSNDLHVEMLRTATLNACQTYLNFIDQKQREAKGKFFVTSFMGLSAASNLTHTMGDINILHELMAFLNQHAGLPTFSTTLQEIKEFSLRFSNQDSDNAFKGILDDELLDTFQAELNLLESYFEIPHPSSPSLSLS